MKKIFVISAILILIVLFVGFSTNPSYAEYKEWFKSKTYEEVEASTELEKSVTGFIADIVSDAGVVRKDHKIYSIYTLDSEEYNYKVIGLFNNFYIMNDEKIETSEN